MLATTLDLEANPFFNTLKKVDHAVAGTKGKIEGFGGAFAGVATAAAGAMAAFVSVGAVVAGFKKTIDLGGELNDLSANTGQSVEDLMLLRKAFQNAGLGADAVQTVFAKFQGKLGGLSDDTGPAAEAVAKLGLTVDGLKGMTALEQIEALQGGFAKLTDQTEKANIMQTLFGKGTGTKMGALLGDPEAMKTAKEQLGGLPGMMQKIAPVLDTIGDAIGAIADKFTQFFAGALSEAGPELQDIFVRISKVDLSGIGKMFGVIVNWALKLEKAMNPILSIFEGIAAVANKVMGTAAPAGKKSESASAGFSEGEGGTSAKEKKFNGFGSLTSRGLNAFSGPVLSPGNDPMLSRADRQVASLERIEKLLQKQPGTTREPLPV